MSSNIALVGLLLVIVIAGLGVAAIYCFNKWMRLKLHWHELEQVRENNKALASLRITAYERLTIMLERITPQALIMRLSPEASTAANLQMTLMRAIREEYEHNVSLQIYVSPECWSHIERAKEDVQELVKVAFSKVNPNGLPLELSRTILFMENEVGNYGIQRALLSIRQEMNLHFKSE